MPAGQVEPAGSTDRSRSVHAADVLEHAAGEYAGDVPAADVGFALGRCTDWQRRDTPAVPGAVRAFRALPGTRADRREARGTKRCYVRSPQRKVFGSLSNRRR